MEQDVPPPPDGFEIQVEPGSRPDFIEQIRLNLNLSKMKKQLPAVDAKLNAAAQQQYYRMLHMDLLTTGVAVQDALSGRVRSDPDVQAAYLHALFNSVQELERAELNASAEGKAAPGRNRGREKILEFALLDATLLLPRHLKLGAPDEELLPRWADAGTQNDAAGFAGGAFTFLDRYVRDESVAEYLGFGLALTPGGMDVSAHCIRLANPWVPRV